MTGPHKLTENWLHLGLGARAEILPPFTGDLSWYQKYGRDIAGKDGIEGRLVSIHTFTGSWDSWEVHPKGDEVVICLTGEIIIIQEDPDTQAHCRVSLAAGDYAINKPGVWHTADVPAHATALFITAGEGTEHRPR